MSRTLTFDRTEKVWEAVKLFSEQGYEATSMQDVADRLGLNRSSIYNTFGSKHDLYLEALDVYRQKGLRALRTQLTDAPTAIDGIRAAFEAVAREALTSSDGCLITNASVERTACDPAVKARTEESLEEMRTLFQDAVEHAQREGDVDPSRDAQALGRCLTNAYNGLRVTAKSEPCDDVVHDIVRETLHCLIGPAR